MMKMAFRVIGVAVLPWFPLVWVVDMVGHGAGPVETAKEVWGAWVGLFWRGEF